MDYKYSVQFEYLKVFKESSEPIFVNYFFLLFICVYYRDFSSNVSNSIRASPNVFT